MMITRVVRKKGREEDENEEEDAREEDAHEEEEESMVFYIGAGAGAAADKPLRVAAAVRAYGQRAAQRCSRRGLRRWQGLLRRQEALR
eukprot:9473404-Pyramimonas_sp.AAC.1